MTKTTTALRSGGYAGCTCKKISQPVVGMLGPCGVVVLSSPSYLKLYLFGGQNFPICFGTSRWHIYLRIVLDGVRPTHTCQCLSRSCSPDREVCSAVHDTAQRLLVEAKCHWLSSRNHTATNECLSKVSSCCFLAHFA